MGSEVKSENRLDCAGIARSVRRLENFPTTIYELQLVTFSLHIITIISTDEANVFLVFRDISLLVLASPNHRDDVFFLSLLENFDANPENIDSYFLHILSRR